MKQRFFEWLIKFGPMTLLMLSLCVAINVGCAQNGPSEANSTPATPTTLVATYATNDDSSEMPPTLPLSEMEAPISVLKTTEDGPYPDALQAEISLHDLTDGTECNLNDVYPDDFLINRDHNYCVCLYLSSEGDPIKDVWCEVQMPNTKSNPLSNCIRFVASDSKNKQPLLSARIYLTTNDGDDFTLQTFTTDGAIYSGGMLIGDIESTPTEIGVDFYVIP